MNRLRACQILELSDDDHDEADIKRQYRRLALSNHPDRNPNNPAATQLFQEIHEAYEFLLNHPSSAASVGYQDLLFEYLTSLLRMSANNNTKFQDVATQLFYTIAERLTSKCETKAFSMLERMDKPTFLKVYGLLKKCNDVLFVCEDWKARLDDLFRAKTQNDHVVVLKPRLQDLLEDQVYRVTLDGHTFYIPLWHHELVYDCPPAEEEGGGLKGELTVQCIPAIPDNMTIDANNNLHVHIQTDCNSLWSTVDLEIPCCSKKTLHVDRTTLFLKEHQRITFKGEGIAKIDDRDIYDVSKRADIIVHLRIVR